MSQGRGSALTRPGVETDPTQFRHRAVSSLAVPNARFRNTGAAESLSSSVPVPRDWRAEGLLHPGRLDEFSDEEERVGASCNDR